MSFSRRGRAVKAEEWQVSRMLVEGQKEPVVRILMSHTVTEGAVRDTALLTADWYSRRTEGKRQGSQPATAGQG